VEIKPLHRPLFRFFIHETPKCSAARTVSWTFPLPSQVSSSDKLKDTVIKPISSSANTEFNMSNGISTSRLSTRTGVRDSISDAHIAESTQQWTESCDHSDLCKTCSEIEQHLKDSLSGKPPRVISSKREVVLMGILKNIRMQPCSTCSRPRQCPLCRKLCEILDLENTNISEYTYLTFKLAKLSLLNDDVNCLMEEKKTTLQIDDESMIVSRPLLFKIYIDSPLLRDKELFLTAVSPFSLFSESGPYQSSIRLIQPKRVDVDFARYCLERCQEKHGEICNGIDATITRYKPRIYLLDLENRCLVRSTVDADYATLSYVWGPQIENFECKMDNLERFLKPGSMNDPGFFKVPALIKSAIDFTIKVGKRYLWIDRCCIVQDDGRHKREQVMAMGIIYAQACFTIVSSDGDARSGLPGLGSLTGSITPARQPNIYHQTPECQVLYGLRYNSVPSNGSWASRGWTFQEQMFSRRMAIFVNGKFVWKCRTSLCQEDFNSELTTEYQSQRGLCDTLISPGWPDMHLFQGLVENYTRRTLTHPCDSISAFSGVLTSLHGSFFGGFLFGLPELYFDVALLWQPYAPLKDRKALAESTGLPVEPLPTWSWCRWQGKLNFEPWAAASECLVLSLYEQNICKTIPIVGWFKIDTRSGARKPICNWFSAYRGQDLARYLSPKWRKDPKSGGFQHSDIGQSKVFRFPVPVLPRQSTANFAPKEENWDTKILGTVEHAYLFLGKVALDDREHDEKPSYGVFGWRYLLSGPGDVVGVIWSSIDKSQGNGWPLDDGLDEEIAECIAISKGEFCMKPGNQSVGISERQFHNWELARRIKWGFYRFYNVMWIDRTDRVAYRRAVGRVDRDIWDRLRPEKIEILLG
jgi:hypothetical protein